MLGGEGGRIAAARQCYLLRQVLRTCAWRCLRHLPHVRHQGAAEVSQSTICARMEKAPTERKSSVGAFSGGEGGLHVTCTTFSPLFCVDFIIYLSHEKVNILLISFGSGPKWFLPFLKYRFSFYLKYWKIIVEIWNNDGYFAAEQCLYVSAKIVFWIKI